MAMVQKKSDDLDRRLVALLQANAREPVSSLARKLKIPRSTVHERITRLLKNGVISGFSVVLNRDPFQNYSMAIVFISVEAKQNRRTIKKLEDFPEIKTCFAVNGQYDICVIIETPFLEDLDVVLDEIGELQGVKATMSSIVLAKKFDRRFEELRR